jgi:hypothetical protein
MSAASSMRLRSFIIRAMKLADNACRGMNTKMNSPVYPKLAPISPFKRADLAFCILKGAVGAVGMLEMSENSHLLLDLLVVEVCLGIGVCVFYLDGCTFGLIMLVFLFETGNALDEDVGGDVGLQSLDTDHQVCSEG